jgi:hypothetical protein
LDLSGLALLEPGKAGQVLAGQLPQLPVKGLGMYQMLGNLGLSTCAPPEEKFPKI